MDLPGQLPVDEPADWEAVPEGAGVYSLTVGDAPPRLGMTRVLRRRLTRFHRLLASSPRAAETKLSYRRTGSDFESRWLLYQLASELRPGAAGELLRLRPPYFLKAHLTNRFPRTFVTQRLTSGRAMYFGPFRRRAAAERFESEFLDFFGVRRCSDNLEPSPEHPGCVYGEMGQCLRPCQTAVGEEAYRAEMARLLEALRTHGASLVAELELQRDEASTTLEFEEAARLHERVAKARQTMRLAEEPARELDALRGAMVQPSADHGHIEIWLLDRAVLKQLPAFPIRIEAPIPLDGRLREHIARGADPDSVGEVARADHMALLIRWYGSSFRQGELILIDSWDRLPLRRLVNAVSRVYRAAADQSS